MQLLRALYQRNAIGPISLNCVPVGMQFLVILRPHEGMYWQRRLNHGVKEIPHKAAQYQITAAVGKHPPPHILQAPVEPVKDTSDCLPKSAREESGEMQIIRLHVRST